MQQILGVFGYLEMDAGQGGDFGFLYPSGATGSGYGHQR